LIGWRRLTPDHIPAFSHLQSLEEGSPNLADAGVTAEDDGVECGQALQRQSGQVNPAGVAVISTLPIWNSTPSA
jgi:hypothetical protein